MDFSPEERKIAASHAAASEDVVKLRKLLTVVRAAAHVEGAWHMKARFSGNAADPSAVRQSHSHRCSGERARGRGARGEPPGRSEALSPSPGTVGLLLLPLGAVVAAAD